MTHVVSAHFDGTVIVPNEPVELPVGTPLILHVEVQQPSADAAPTPGNAATGRFAGLLELAADLPDAPPDLAAQHDHYLYGSPKR